MANSQQSVSIKAGYVLVERAPGYEVLPDEQPARLMEISVACKKAGCRKVLVVGPRTKVRLSTMDIFSLGEQVAKLQLQVAVVELHDASNEDVGFLEDVVTNRGSSMQFFCNEQEAKEWLGVE